MSGAIKYPLLVSLVMGCCLSFATGQEATEDQPIRLVVGKQPGSRKDMVHRAAPTGRRPGLLDRLMQFGSSSSKDDNTKVTPLPASERQPADWSNVPYHEPGRTTAASSQPRPVADPGRQAVGSGTPRVRSSRSTPSNGLSLGPIPTPPSVESVRRRPLEPEAVAATPEPSEFSPTFSSRRSGRRAVEPLDDTILSASDLMPRADRPNQIGNRAIELDSEPHVQQRRLPIASAETSPTTEPRSTATANNTPTTSSRRSASGTAKPADVPPSLAKQPSAGQPLGTEPAAPAAPRALAANAPVEASTTDVPTRSVAPQASPQARVASRPVPGGSLNLGLAVPAETAAEQAPSGKAGVQSLPGLDPSDMVPSPAVAQAPSATQASPAAQASPSLAVPSNAGLSENRQAAIADRVREDSAASEAPIGSGVVSSTNPPATNGGATNSVPATDGWQAKGGKPQTGMSLQPSNNVAKPIGDGSHLAGKPLSTDGNFTSVPAEVPGLRVIAEGPSQIMIRQTTKYEIRVENRGAVAAPGVLVRTAIPGWIGIRGKTVSRGNITMDEEQNKRQLLWEIDSLPAGAVERLTLQVEAEKSGSFGVAVDWTLLPQENKLLVNVREPKLQLLIEGPDQVVYGESETYKVRVLNPGDGIAPNVVFTLSPNSATPQSQQIGSIPPGKEAQFEVELTAQDLGDLKIHGLATGDLQLRTEGAKTIRVAAAQLEAMLTGPPLRYQNGEADYKLQLQNAGVATSRDVMASLRLPTGIEYLGGLQDARVVGDTLRWKIDRLEAGATRDYAFRCKMSTTGAHLLAFECRGTAAGQAAVSITTNVEALADLVLTINDPSAPAPVGEDVVYELVITNRGSKAAVDVQALTHFSDHIEPTRIEGHAGKISVGQVQFDKISRIDPGQTVTLRIVAQANQDGNHRFRAEVTADETVLVAEEATRYLSPMNDQISRRSSDDVSWE